MAGFPGWENALLRLIGAPTTTQNIRFLRAWQRAEGGSARFNPFNTTQRAGGAGAYNSVGVRNYASAQQGLNATAQTLLNGRYNRLVGLLRQGNANPQGLAQVLGSSPWGTSGSLVSKILGGGSGAQLPAFGGQLLQGNTSPPPDDNVRMALARQLIQNLGSLTSNHAPNFQATNQLLSQLHAPHPSMGMAQGLPTPVPTGHGVGNFDGKPVASWIAKILHAARAAGWKGTVTSGYRSLAEQTHIYNSGVRPAARPGTSNHEFTAFPGGAVDVTRASELASILRQLGLSRLLQWAGGKDPVHFSHPHNGGY